MNQQDAKDKMDELVDKLHYHSYKYYVLDSPEITDYEYDVMMEELTTLENTFPELIMEDTPTQRVGGQPLSAFQQVQQIGRAHV